MVSGAKRTERLPDGMAFTLLTLFAAFMYIAPAEWIPGVEILRPALVTSGLAAALMVFRRLGRGIPVSVDGARGIALLLFVLLAAASISWSVFAPVSVSTVGDLVKLAAIYFTLVNVVITPRRLVLVCGALVLGSIVTSIGVIQWFLIGKDLVDGFRSRWIGVYGDPNHMAAAMGIVVPLAVAFITHKKVPLLMKVASIAAAGLAVTAIVLSVSRGGFIGLTIAMIVWAAREKGRRVQATVVAFVLAIGLVLFAPKSFWERNESVAQFQQDESARGRIHAWEVASNISTDRPLLGVGVGAFKYAWPLYARFEAKRAYVAHNIFLDVIGELGFVGLLFFLVFAGGATGGAFNVPNQEDHAWMARGLAASMVGYLICDLFSGYILSSHLYVLFGLAASAERMVKRPEAAALPVVFQTGLGLEP